MNEKKNLLRLTAQVSHDVPVRSPPHPPIVVCGMTLAAEGKGSWWVCPSRLSAGDECTEIGCRCAKRIENLLVV